MKPHDTKQEHWIIDVASWGVLFAIGSEEQAEEWRRHKANWEHSVVRKRKATEEEIKEHAFLHWKTL